jgi:hypothetical protein
MVGVGGRSRACTNCKRRRIKCGQSSLHTKRVTLNFIAHIDGVDLGSPQCRRCVLANLQCGGIQDLAILQYDGQKNVSKPIITDASVAAQPTKIEDQLRSRAQQRSPWTIAVIPRWQSQPLSQDLFKAYTNNRLFHGTWSAVVLDEKGQPLTSACFSALSTTFFGLEHRHKPTIHDGLSSYGSVLRKLNESLNDPTKSSSLDTLTSVIALTLFELLSSDQEHGWLSHSRGLEKLFAMLGAERVAALPLLTLFEKSRANMIFSALLSRQATVLSTLEWKTVPWRYHPDRIDALKTLHDILADCADLFYLRETMHKREFLGLDIQTLSELDEKAYTVIFELDAWKATWANSAAYRTTEVHVSDMAQSKGRRQRVKPPWTSVLRYETFYHASVMVLYHGMAIMIYTVVQEARAALGLDEHEDTTKIIYEAGLTICRSADYHLDVGWASTGSLLLLFPLRMAAKAVGNSDPAANTWLKETLESIASGSAGRWHYAQHLLNTVGLLEPT